MNGGGTYIAFAPLQGYTDAPYRRAHWECAGGVTEYYTPFVRLEGEMPRHKDLRNVSPEACDGVPTVPQVIARDAAEFARLCDAIQDLGWTRIDLNMGCPFPMQVHTGRGSGLLLHLEHIEAIALEMQRRPEVTFSAKMRLGQNSTDEGLHAMDIMNEMPLCHVTLHPRLGRQQYKGMVDLEAFTLFQERCTHPMVYNGDIVGVENGEWQVKTEAGTVCLPTNTNGLMIGRGLLARPWMLCDRRPTEVLREMHDRIYQHATTTLCGDSQILSRLHAFWEFVDIDHKFHKAIKKATTLRRYNEAVAIALKERP